MRDRLVALLVSLHSIMAPPRASAQAVELAPFPIADAGLHAPFHIDGALEPAWDAIPAVDAFEEYRPRQGVPATVRTEVRFARDSRYFYAAARMFDPDIGRLRSGLARRDNFSNEQDWISLAIDPVGARRVAQLFYFNPDGVIWDGLSNEDTGTSTPAADFEVEVATRVLADSWVVELRIPFEELRYTTRSPERWHVLVRRNYPREERHAMAAPPIPATAPCFMCLAAPLHPPGELPAPRGLQFVPQVAAVATGEGSRSRLDWHSTLEPSADVKFRASPATVFDATINPDFSQVELDTPQLTSNQQFAVGYPEKRPFFLEGLDILEAPLQAIYTRAITDPAWGVRGTQRGRWDGVLLTTRDDGGGYRVLPGPYFARYELVDDASLATIARVRAPLGAVTVGALATDRRAEDSFNSVAGADVAWRVSPATRLNVQWLGSRTRGEADATGAQPGTAQGHAATIDLYHDTEQWRVAATLAELDDEFRADNGYVPQVGIRSLATELRYKFTELPRVSELAPYISTDTREDLAGARVSSAPRAGAQLTLPSNLVLIGEWRPREEVRTRVGGPLHVFSQAYLSLTAYPGARAPVATLSAVVGDAVDFSRDRLGNGETLAASLLLRPVSRLELEPRIDLTTVRTGAPAGMTRESAVQLLATLHLSARARFRLILQRVAAERSENGVDQEETRAVGSLLFTHERSLTRRIYGGITWARSSATGTPGRDDAEVFLKIQSGMSTTTGARW